MDGVVVTFPNFFRRSILRRKKAILFDKEDNGFCSLSEKELK